MKYKELHLHLEGAVFESALNKISKRRTLRPFRNYISDKDSFFEKMNYISSEVLTCKEDYKDAFEVLCNFLSATHSYAEIIVSPGAFEYYHNGDFEEILRELSDMALKEKEVKINFLIDILKNRGPEKCWDYVEFARKCKNLPGIAGINLGGDEIRYPVKHYIPHIKKSKEYGMTVSVHAGEWGGPDEVWTALEGGADRIGHGIQASKDKCLTETLSKRGIILEVCPTSNLYTGASKDLHELIVLADRKVDMTINTDDPAVFNVSLEHELNLFKKLIPDYDIMAL